MSHFRPTKAVEISPVWIALLGVFDLMLIGYLIVQIWRM